MLNGEAQFKNRYLVEEPSLRAPLGSLKLPTFQYTLISLELIYYITLLNVSLMNLGSTNGTRIGNFLKVYF